MPTALSLEDLGIRQPPPLSVSQSRPASDGAGERTHIEEDLPRFTREMTAKLERLATQAEDEVATEGVEFLDGLIDRLAAIEEGTRAQWREMKKTRDKGCEIRKILQDLPESAAGRQLLLQSVEEPVARIEAWIEASEALLPAYRDARWKLMALRADHEDAGDAPVFEDPEQLEQYLTRG